MKREIPPIEEPLNASERFLYACAVRLDAIYELLKEGTAEKEVVEAVPNEVIVEEEPIKCKGKTKKGKACSNTAVDGSEYCSIHDRG